MTRGAEINQENAEAAYRAAHPSIDDTVTVWRIASERTVTLGDGRQEGVLVKVDAANTLTAVSWSCAPKDAPQVGDRYALRITRL